MVDVEFVERFEKPVSLAQLKSEPELAKMHVLRRGQRLSVMPVEPGEFELVAKLGRG